MEESESQTMAAPFLTKTYEMVDDPITNPLVSWSEKGYSFVVWNPPDFARDLLPMYFKHNNFSSFVRQLNTYGFRKIDPEQWEFGNEGFMRGKKHLLNKIQRRKPIHSHSSALLKPERQVMEARIRRLKQENNLLELELQRRSTENHSFSVEVESLAERLRKLENHQMQLINFFAQMSKKPGFATALIQQHSQVLVRNKKRRRLLILCDGDDDGHGDLSHMISTSNNMDKCGRLSEEMIEKMEASLNYWSGFIYGSGGAFAEDVYDFGVIPQLSAVSVEHEQEEEEDCHDSEDIGAIEITKSSSPEPQTNQTDSASPTATAVGVNDIFWEQFFTETPTTAS